MNRVKTTSRPRKTYRDSANAAIEPSPTASTVATVAISALFPRNSQNAALVRIVP